MPVCYICLLMSYSVEPTRTSCWVRTVGCRLCWWGPGSTAWPRPGPGRRVRTPSSEGWWRTFMLTSWGTSSTGSHNLAIKLLGNSKNELLLLIQVPLIFKLPLISHLHAPCQFQVNSKSIQLISKMSDEERLMLFSLFTVHCTRK